MVQVGGDLFAVSGLDGVVQLLQWNAVEQRFLIVRRIGALAGLTGLALDSGGTLWTPYGSLRWDASSETPFSSGDRQPDLHAQPVVLGGRTLCLLKKHYSYVQLARGPPLDGDGLSHFESPPMSDFELPADVTGAAAFPSGGDWRMIVATRGGAAWEFGLTERGEQKSRPERVALPGLSNCTSLAWFDGRLCAAAPGTVLTFARGDGGWRETARIPDLGTMVFVGGDGARLAVSDTQRGTVRVYGASGAAPIAKEGLASPTHVAVSGDRVVVYEAGRQRLARFELCIPSRGAAPGPAVESLPQGTPAASAPADEAFQEMGRPGGIPLAIAWTTNRDGAVLSVRTKPGALVTEIGVANAARAYVVSARPADPARGRYDVALPAGDWSRPRLALAVRLPGQQERFGFADGRAIHEPFSRDASTWAAFDVEAYREGVEARRREIRIGFDQPVDGKATLVIEDDNGARVRNLVSGRAFAAGPHTIVWDGLDENGTLVTPGTYRWRGLTHAGLDPRYRMSFANGGEPGTEPWGPNHSTLHAAAAGGGRIFFAAPVTEGGWALLALDADGAFAQGYEHQQGLGIGHNAIAADDRFLYCAQDGFGWGGSRDADPANAAWVATWKLTVVRFDIVSGKLVEWPGRSRSVEADTMEVGPGSKHPDLDDYNLGGIAVLDGRLYVGSRNREAVLVLDAATGRPVDSLPCAGVRHLAAGRGEVLAATDRGIVRLRDGRRLIEAGARVPGGLAIAPNGDIAVSDGESHRVLRFDRDGRLLAAIGRPGGPYQGAYDPARMVNPAGLAFGPDGKLWVTEKRWNPKRLLAWDPTGSRVVVEKFGMPHYGGDGAGFDPENPRRWIGLGCFWDVDIAKGTARPTHVLSAGAGHFGRYEPQGYSFFREAGRTFVSARGKIALISEVMSDGTLHDLVAVAGTHHFGYGCEWKPPQAYIDAFYAKWPAKRAGEKPGRKGEGKPWSQRGMGVLWVDRNGDGQVQQEEFDFCGDEIDFCGGAWGHVQNSLTLRVPVASDKRQSKIAAIRPRGFLPNGVPDYPALDAALAEAVPVRLAPGYKRSGVATIYDGQGRFLFNSDPEMNAFAADGRWLWSYPNRWSDVHGSHDAPLPEPGVLQGTLAFLGLAPLDREGDVVVLNGNHGRCFVMTTDGLYVDEAFADVRVSYLKNEYRLGGEIFGGSFGRSAVDGRTYVQVGHGPYRIYELEGLSTARRMSGSVSVDRDQIAASERQVLRKAAARRAPRELTIPGRVRWDKSGRFRAEAEVTVDSTHLHLAYHVEDPSPWVNRGREWSTLFATGDTVDFQFGADPDADPRRREPVAGDKRLMIAPYGGGVVAVLFEHRKPGGGHPIEFTSPWRGVRVDDVRRLAGARIDVKIEDAGYTVRADVPFAELGLGFAPGRRYAADFGVTFGDAGGTDTNLRSYWSNQSTALVDDIPGEIMISPHLWGSVQIGK